jgi:hypothetical protein
MPAPRPAVRRGTAADPLRVMVWGDSVAVTLEGTVATTLARLAPRAGPAVVLGRAALGFGLGDTHPSLYRGQYRAPVFTDWPTRIGRTLQTDRPDEVIVLLGTWDTWPRLVDGHWLRPGTPQWSAWYTAVVTDAARRLTATGAHVTWLTHPCVLDQNANPILPEVNAIYRTVASRVPNVSLVDLAAMVCPGGRYTESMPGPDGKLVAVRSPEGTHFELSSALVLDRPLAAVFARVWHLPAA